MKIKKMFAVLSAASILAAVMPVQAFAAGTPVKVYDKVSVTEGGVKLSPVISNTIRRLDLQYDVPCGGSRNRAMPTVPEGSGVIIEGFSITDSDHNDFSSFEKDKEYIMNLTLKALDGHSFDIDTDDNTIRTRFMINGSDSGILLVIDPYQLDTVDLIYSFSVTEDPHYIENAPLSFIVPSKDSDRISEPNVTAQGDDFEVVSSYFKLNEGVDFAEGETYTVNAVLKPKKGHLFKADNDMKEIYTNVYVNGDPVKASRFGEIPSDLIKVEFDFVFLHRIVDSVDIDFTVPEVGTYGETEPFLTTAPGSPFNIVSAEYRDSDNMAGGFVFEEGQEYNLVVVVEPADGYSFDLANSIKINGSEEVMFAILPEGRLSLLYSFTVGETADIKKADIKFTPPPTNGILGETEVSAVSPVGYEIKASGYFDKDFNAVSGKVKEDEMYFIVVQISPKKGYKFTGDTVYTMNGEKPFKIISGGVMGDDVIIAAMVFPYGEKDILLGDVDLNGKIDIEDAVMVINHVNGGKALKGDSLYAANCNGDTKIDIEDAVMIISQINGIKLIPQPESRK